MRFLVAALLTLSCSVVSAQQGESFGIYDFKSFADHPVQKSLVVIDVDGGRASGIHLGGGKILTAQHVVKDNETVKIIVPYARLTKTAKVVRKDEDRDLALLQCDGLETPSVKLADKKLKPGDGCQFLGFSGFKLPRHFDAKVLDAGEGVILLNSPVQMGDSGGAILNAKGELVGIVLAGMVPIQKPIMIPTKSGKVMFIITFALCRAADRDSIGKFLIES